MVLNLLQNSTRLQVIREGKLSTVDGLTGEQSLSSDLSFDGFDVLGNLQLLLIFSEKDPESQQADSSLKDLFDQVLPESEMRDGARGYFLQDLLLVRKWVWHSDTFVGDPVFQIALPVSFRQSVLKVAHDESGHSGVKKTYDRLLWHFFWPHMKKGVSAFIKTCHTCQLTDMPNQTLKPAPLCPIPAVS